MVRLPPLPLALKVPLTVALLMGIVGIFASQLVVQALVRSQERQLRELAQLEFEGLEATLGPLVLRDDVWEMFSLLDRVTRRGTGLRPIRATLVDPGARVVVSSAPDRAPLGSSGQALIAESVPVDRLSYERATDLVALRRVQTFEGQPLGQMVIEFDARALVAERRNAAWLLVLGNAAATLILAVAGYLVVRRALRPVSRLAAQMADASGAPQPIDEAAIPEGESEVARLYRTYNRMVRAVEERNAAERRLADRERFVSLGRLAGTLAHEINNPLGGLLNAVDTLRAYPERPAVVAGSAELLDRGLRHLRDVVRATLDTHRDPRGAAPLGLTDFEDLRMLIRPEVARQGQRLDWQVAAPEDCLARLPAGPVRQIALNLLLNASAAAGPGGRLGLSVRATDEALDLRIRDSGPGLPDSLRPRLLSDDPVEPGGGVGLRLVRDLVRSLGGQVSVGQSPEGLNEIRLILPCIGEGCRC
ncbi:ArxS, sensor/HAMP domain-containing histidine kinase (plasmid) [Cereibacter azotoformans]|uniref:sensor histidine kinase n=1 Tax=Cereibacter azotoformans TaxID=43057 RepID=UPI001EEA7F80|nr:HAMP domain-containing sensor histidine kinase [Cereibacter azotoformans]ULB12470.1 ArxS, sensor/HAMP domain-containing histidine kinase [Cereibacter azotoformans]